MRSNNPVVAALIRRHNQHVKVFAFHTPIGTIAKRATTEQIARQRVRNEHDVTPMHLISIASASR